MSHLSPQRSAPILGLDNVPLELPIAGVGSRLLAVILDYLLLTVLLAAWCVGAILVGVQLEAGLFWTYALLLVGPFLLQWGYFAAFEIATDGQTPGKMALGLRVVSRRGGAAGPAPIVVRNLLRNVDLLIGVPIVAIDRRGRRLGDFAAGTLVVHEPRAGAPVLGHPPEGWAAAEVAVVESFVRRAPLLEPDHRRRMAEQLVGWMERRHPELPVEPGWRSDPVAALRAVLAGA